MEPKYKIDEMSLDNKVHARKYYESFEAPESVWKPAAKANIDYQYKLAGINPGESVSDYGTTILNGMKTLGGSLIGDAINSVSPKLAKDISKYSLGMIEPTSKETYLKGREDSWGNRLNTAAEGVSSVVLAEIMGPGIKYAGDKVAGKMAGEVIQSKPATRIFNIQKKYTKRGINPNKEYDNLIDDAWSNSIAESKTPFTIERPATNTLQLKSLMAGSPLEKQLSKDGALNINSLRAYLDNQATSNSDRIMINKVLDEKFGGGHFKINYNDLRKAVSDEMVPLEKNLDSNYSNYGVGALGYPGVQKESVEKAIGYAEENFRNLYRNRKQYGIESVKTALGVVRENRAMLKSLANENTSIIYSNKRKFGRGSTDHFENEGTLGHSRILVSNEEKDVMHVLEQQSDFYQKNKLEFNPNKEYSSIVRMHEHLDNLKGQLKEMVSNRVHPDGSPVTNTDVIQQRNLILSQENSINLSRGNLENYTQKELLGRTHQERLLQENVAHAAQNGQTKMRYPTPETAVKIQGYKKEVPFEEWDPYDQLEGVRGRSETINKYGPSPEQKTILKKYADNPKIVKKTLGVDTRTVVDSKGNSWYEFDIPEAFIKNKAEIKALSAVGVIGTTYNKLNK